MIKKHCLERTWIIENSARLGGADPTLLEKTILAFDLLGRLKHFGLSFVFKGGTSLLLLLEHFNRLSIDVDIVCNQDEKKQREIFDLLIADSPFTRWEEDPRRPSPVPKKHFKFYFTSQINQRRDYVLLDILHADNLFPKLQEKPIRLPFLETRENISVSLPSIDSLIGDKLTAFAPRTIGVPLDARRSMQMIKQLFDLGELFLRASTLQEIALSYHAFAKTENSYRHTTFSVKQTLQDTLNICFLITQLDLKGGVENEMTAILRKGIRQIGSHLIGLSFGIQQAKIAAARVAFLVALLMAGSEENIPRFIYNAQSIEEIREAALSENLAPVHRIKGSAPEVFYYWYRANRYIKNVAYPVEKD